MWIARDEYTGSVHLFERKPVREIWWGYVKFLDSITFNDGLPLGKRPKLAFKLKQGTARKVQPIFQEVK